MDQKRIIRIRVKRKRTGFFESLMEWYLIKPELLKKRRDAFLRILRKVES
jgi:hypothetical protein